MLMELPLEFDPDKDRRNQNQFAPRDID